MLVRIDQIDNNPFRDFSIYPLDAEQVERVEQSLRDLGMFTSLPGRRHGKRVQIAVGHHRLVAARRAKFAEIDINVQDYDDLTMVRLMAVENLTQRGHNAASTLDAVAAFSRIVAKEVLLGEGDSAKILALSGDRFLSKAQTEIALDGPGKDLLYRAINGFSKADRAEKKQAERITETEISQSLGALKDSGRMAHIVAAAHAEVVTIRAERLASAEAKAKSQKARQALQEQQTELGERQQKEQVAIAAQIETPPIYDMNCGKEFRLSSHEAAFRSGITSENGRRFIAVTQQLALAQDIRKRIDEAERGLGRDLGSVSIDRMVSDAINDAIRAQKGIDEEERKALLSADTHERVRDKWKQLAATVSRSMTFLDDLRKAEEQWDYERDGAFPIDAIAMDRIEMIERVIGSIKLKLGGRPDHTSS